MAKYRAKQINEIEAEQFLPPNQIPKGVFNVYGSPNGEVYSGQVWTIQGERVNVKAGEWIVQEPDNPERYYLLSYPQLFHFPICLNTHFAYPRMTTNIRFIYIKIFF